MKNDHVLVTAIYNHSPRSRIGGRGYDINFYKAPFYNIIKLGLPVVIFTHEPQKDHIENFLTQVGAENYKIIVYDLETTDITNIVLLLKEKYGLIDEHGLAPHKSIMSNDRNHVLCLKKLHFLKYAIDNKLFEGKNYYWIDAGLFHHGLFPETFGGKEKLIGVHEEQYWPINEKNIFRPGLIESLVNKNQQNYIFIMTTGYYGMPVWWNTISPAVERKGHVVGGLFGGDVSITQKIYEEFTTRMYQLFEIEHLPLEEEILSLVFAEHYSTMIPFEFDIWYHDIPSDPCGMHMEENARCFYKIFINKET